MEYIYDIVLNFQDNYYDFYEWQKKDKIIPIKVIIHSFYIQIDEDCPDNR